MKKILLIALIMILPNIAFAKTFSSHSECKDALLASMLSIQGRHNAECMVVVERDNFASAECSNDKAIMTIRCEGKVLKTSSYKKDK